MRADDECRRLAESIAELTAENERLREELAEWREGKRTWAEPDDDNINYGLPRELR